MSATGHKSGILGSCFSEDGKYLISMSKDGTVKEWSLDVKWESGANPQLMNTYSHSIPCDARSGGKNIKYVNMNNRKFIFVLGSDIEILEMCMDDEKVIPFSKIENAHNGEKIDKGTILVNIGKTMEDEDSVFLVTSSVSKVCIWD